MKEEEGFMYPTEEELEKVRTWPYRDPAGWFAYVQSLWRYPDYFKEESEGEYTDVYMATGGWSGNESVVKAMEKNLVLWSMTWESSHRGGAYSFRYRPEWFRKEK